MGFEVQRSGKPVLVARVGCGEPRTASIEIGDKVRQGNRSWFRVGCGLQAHRILRGPTMILSIGTKALRLALFALLLCLASSAWLPPPKSASPTATSPFANGGPWRTGMSALRFWRTGMSACESGEGSGA